MGGPFDRLAGAPVHTKITPNGCWLLPPPSRYCPGRGGAVPEKPPAAQGRYDTSRTKLLCFGAAGFKDSLRREAAANGDLILVDADELYGG